MANYDNISDEEELHKLEWQKEDEQLDLLMNAAEDFDERKKIRARLREVRDKQRAEWEAKRKAREAAAADMVKLKFEKAEEEKKKKMEAYKNQAPTHQRESKYASVSQSLIDDKKKLDDEDKAKKLAAYSKVTEQKTGPAGEEITCTTVSSTQKTPGGGTRTVITKKTETSSTSGFGGVQYGKPAAKPATPKNAFAAFKSMDAANAPAGAPRAKPLARSPTAIKQILLEWAKSKANGYPGVEITNFSSSWNNGLAFCALIHHFFPDAFDFEKLDPKKRRYNFTLAFDTAEQKADIAPLLDVDDMVKMKNPDWKCVFTYVQSIYRHLRDHEKNQAAPPPAEQ